MNKVVLILLFFLSPIIFAKNLHVEETETIARLFTEKKDFTKKENRKLLATALISNLIKLNQLIPKNTPDDESWLKKEIQESEAGTQRQIIYLSTPIFSKFWLKDRMEWMILNLNETITTPISLQDETIIWTTIGDELHSNSEMINENLQQLVKNHIIDRNKLSETTGMPPSISQAYMYTIWGHDIIQQVVIPSIRNIQ